MAKQQAHETDDSHDVAKMWFRVTMACTAIFVSVVFLFIVL